MFTLCHLLCSPALLLCREAQEEGEYAEAFWLCAQCIKSMEELGEGLGVGQQVGAVAGYSQQALAAAG
jgi:hypothetical protein